MNTIRDVAKKAGVSVATVSRVINNKGKVSEKTELAVLQAIKELSYQPNSVARSLSSRKSNVVALIVPSINNAFFPELARAVEDIAQLNGYKLFLCNTDDSREKLVDYLDSLGSQYVDGLIIDSHNIKEEDLTKLSRLGIPVVMIDRVIENSNYTSITVNNRAGGRLATEHLLEVGCKKIAHIQGPKNEMNSVQRMWGYRDQVSKLPWFDESWIAHAEFSVKSGYQATKELLIRHQDMDGIFASNDLIAIGALKAAYEWGKKIPNELAIVGFDGIDMSELTVPGITTIQQPIYQIGELAMHELLNQIKNSHAKPKKYILDIELVLRESTMRSQRYI